MVGPTKFPRGKPGTCTFLPSKRTRPPSFSAEAIRLSTRVFAAGEIRGPLRFKGLGKFLFSIILEYTHTSAPCSKPLLTLSFEARSTNSGNHDCAFPTKTAGNTYNVSSWSPNNPGVTYQLKWPYSAGQQLDMGQCDCARR